jgi:hypothetical protein
MKQKLFISGFIFPVILWFSLESLQGQGNRQKLFSIGKEEITVYGETQIYLENTSTRVIMVTMDFNGKYYLYDIDGRKGPFDDVDSCGFNPGEVDTDMYSSIYNYEGASLGLDLLSFNDEGRTMVRAGNKTYGPFESVTNIYTDKSGKFTMAITSEGMNFSLLTSNGTLLPLESIPYASSVSSSLNKAFVVVVKEENPAADYMNLDFSKMTQDELMKIAREIEEKQKNAPPPEAYVYLNDGKKFGPYQQESIFGGNPFFCKTGGDNWGLLLDKKLYVNGSLLAELPVEYVSAGDIWLSEDGKRFVIISIEKILFSDGQSFANPLKVKMQKEGDKTWFSWICLENETDVVLYSKAL